VLRELPMPAANGALLTAHSQWLARRGCLIHLLQPLVFRPIEMV